MTPGLELIEEEEERLRESMKQLMDSTRAAAYKEFTQKLKDPDTYATLAWSMPLALHHLYLGRWLRTLVDYFLLMAGLSMGMVGVANMEPMPLFAGIAILAGICISEMYCLFRSHAIVRHHNNRLLESIIEEASHRG